MMKSGLVIPLFFLVACRANLRQPTSAVSPTGKWILEWSAEFAGPDGSAPDASKWIVESGGNGWGNGELQYYTARRQNVRIENGNLVVEVVKEVFTGEDGVSRKYTSGRLKTESRFSQKYGRFEARIKIPSGRGMWPAFWLLGDDFSTNGWPRCGEIDIMEANGATPSKVFASVNGPGYSGWKALSSTYKLAAKRFSDEFHVFALEWEPRVLRFYVDDHLYATRTPEDLPASAPWVFDHPFFLILNLAVGGGLANTPDDSTVFPQRMLVDYVRVYSRK